MEALVVTVVAVVFTVPVVVLFVRAIKRAKRISHELWRQVPPPNWRCRRGGIDYL